MLQQEVGTSKVNASRIALGCMRLDKLNKKEVDEVLSTALEHEINFFDHADIYGEGNSELHFSSGIKRLGISRDKLIIQSKCGIRNNCYDFSKKHLLNSVENILKRLNCEFLDFLVLHRPDTLIEPEEVAESFYILKKAGKVKNFGVSNHNRYQIELLQSYLDMPITVNQIQFSPVHTPLIDSGLNFNTKNHASLDRSTGTLEYYRLKQITLQAWSPFQIDLHSGTFLDSKYYKELNNTIIKYSKKYNVSKEAIVISWILRHPAKFQTIIGTTTPKRILGITKAVDITLTREEWYDIYLSANNQLL